jgi:hypothetical protein
MPKLNPKRTPRVDNTILRSHQRDGESYAFWFSSDINNWITSARKEGRAKARKAREL